MRVATYLADQNPHRDRSRGITRMTGCLLGALSGTGVRLLPISSRSSITWPCQAGDEVRLPLSTDRLPLRVLSDGLHRLWPPAARLSVDAWLYPKGFIPWVLPRGSRTVAVVYDAILAHHAEHYPEHIGRAPLAYLVRVLAHSLRRADTVVTVSEHARGQLRRFGERRGFGISDVRVVYAASDYEALLGDRPSRAPKRDTVVHLAATEPHKRTDALLAFWQALQARGRDLPELLLIGNLPPAARRLSTRLRGVRALPGLPEPQFQEAIASARAVLMPSELEGFGLPVLEGYYLGTPGVYVRGTAIDEYMAPVSSHGAFEGDDVDDFERALGRVLALSPEAIHRDALALRQRYSRARLGQGLRDALSG